MNLRHACASLALAGLLASGCCHSHCRPAAPPAVLGTAPAGCAPGLAVAPPPPVAAPGSPPPTFVTPPPPGTGFNR